MSSKPRLDQGSAEPNPSSPDRKGPGQAAKAGPEADAKGQSEKHHKGGSNDGVSSANPRVISGNDDGDATFPYEQKK